ncbi:Poly(A) polymerase [Methylophaga frappieri]|uniref:Poly(A) polymerase I n=1 Tax=Methylophaga frappieri (strain ATCC BAA-2434 / DSM 25690 / JAM7) TaxID=754477 RepID=I1YKX9_METFJ|nr:polynucleotide adenylyltransferase PcnB [Methylophaga frappieri]AFJ03572.1 Poly(A) polymerase [Methylophaga frappieri]
MLSLNHVIDKIKQVTTARKQRDGAGTPPRIVSRAEHNISRKVISPSALKVLYTLKDAGYDAYLVGGCVRDILLGYEPKDFDIATNALPEQVHQLFRRSRMIGRRFKLVHVRFGRNEIIEVATFRAPPEAENQQDGRIMQDNVYGTLEQDAWRRDFTINALYYNIADFTIVDYTGGIADLQQGLIRLIGEQRVRYREDPVRMLRALRFKAKLGLALESVTEKHITELAALLKDIPPARLFDETLKLYLSGQAVQTHQLLCQYGIFEALFPQTAACLQTEGHEEARRLLMGALENTDRRLQQGKPVTPAFLFAAILWAPLRQRWLQLSQKMSDMPAIQRAAGDILAEQIQLVAIPKRFSLVTRDIWTLQPRLARRQGKRAFALLLHPKFRAGYDFLALRAEAGEPLQALTEWWTNFQQASATEQAEMVKNLPDAAPAKRKSRRRRRRRPAAKKPE